MERLTLKEEVKLLRSALVGLIGKDKEGSYRPEFVAEMFADLKRKPTRVFKSPAQFLRDISREK